MIYFIFLTIISNAICRNVILCDSQTGRPLADVNVFTQENGITTDSSGLCSIDIFKQNDQISFSLIGYQTIKVPYAEIKEKILMKRETIPLNLINVMGKKKRSRKYYNSLERNIKKVLPFARQVSELLDEYQSIIIDLEQYSGIIKYHKKRKVFSKIEKDLISSYGFSIKKLTRKQGRILIKLIDRETNNTSYEIIKDFRNVLSAGFWQLTAKVFGHDLRSEYDPSTGEDRLIEFIINKIENSQKHEVVEIKAIAQ